MISLLRRSVGRAMDSRHRSHGARVEALARHVMVRTLSGRLPLTIVNEHPKSGGTWLGHMLSGALGVPFPRHELPPLRACIIHGHYYRPQGMKNVVVLWRDGRDVMVSWYHHCLLLEQPTNRSLRDLVRSELGFTDVHDVRANLPHFLDYAFTRQRHPSFSWAEFVRMWHARPGVVQTSYEALRADTPAELRRVVRDLSGRELSPTRAQEIADQFSFQRMSGRKPGEEDPGSFMRRGVVGDWKRDFSRDARQVFDMHAGRELIDLGYEPDHGWVQRASPNHADDLMLPVRRG